MGEVGQLKIVRCSSCHRSRPCPCRAAKGPPAAAGARGRTPTNPRRSTRSTPRTGWAAAHLHCRYPCRGPSPPPAPRAEAMPGTPGVGGVGPPWFRANAVRALMFCGQSATGDQGCAQIPSDRQTADNNQHQLLDPWCTRHSPIPTHEPWQSNHPFPCCCPNLYHPSHPFPCLTVPPPVAAQISTTPSPSLPMSNHPRNCPTVVRPSAPRAGGGHGAP